MTNDLKVNVKAKPIEWETGTEEWNNYRYGFCINYEMDAVGDIDRYFASWGEGDPEEFPTLQEAKEWCQGEIDSWVQDNVVVELENTKSRRQERSGREATVHEGVRRRR